VPNVLSRANVHLHNYGLGSALTDVFGDRLDVMTVWRIPSQR
jgi:hypothetical protein